jgi:hypothetical protein
VSPSHSDGRGPLLAECVREGRSEALHEEQRRGGEVMRQCGCNAYPRRPRCIRRTTPCHVTHRVRRTERGQGTLARPSSLAAGTWLAQWDLNDSTCHMWQYHQRSPLCCVAHRCTPVRSTLVRGLISSWLLAVLQRGTAVLCGPPLYAGPEHTGHSLHQAAAVCHSQHECCSAAARQWRSGASSLCCSS